MDTTVAKRTERGLRIVTSDDCTVADLSALQRFWTEAQYLTLTNHSHRLIEFNDGCIEILPMPTQRQQAISRFLFLALVAAVRNRGGDVFYAPLRLRIRNGKFREPDIMLVRKAGDPRCRDDFWIGADLVMEVVSSDDPYRDLVEKRIDYAEAGIPEYWIVNPIDDTVTVLVLGDGEYREHGVFRCGTRVDSPTLPEVSISVSDVFEAALPRHHEPTE
jgi:Uma2 family endonuclease